MMPSALKSLVASEKGFAGGMLIIAATIFVLTDRMTVADWQTFCTWIFTTYVAGKTVQGGIAAITAGKGAAPAAEAPAVSEASAAQAGGSRSFGLDAVASAIAAQPVADEPKVIVSDEAAARPSRKRSSKEG